MANDDEARDRARQRVGDELVRRGMTARDLARAAGVDFDTVSDFLNGPRWPQPARRGMIASALGWEPEGIDQVVRGEEPTIRDSESAETVAVPPQDHRVLLDIDEEVYAEMDPISRKRAKAEAEALFYRIAEEARRRADGR